MKTRKITYTAVCTAISTAFILLTIVLPTKIVPLIVSAVCYYIAFNKCSYIGGILSIACSLTITFFINGISTAFILVAVVFAPYAILAYILRRIKYTSMSHSIIRLVCYVLFLIIAIVICYFLARFITAVSFDGLISKIGVYLTLGLIIIACLPFDFFFVFFTDRVLKILK